MRPADAQRTCLYHIPDDSSRVCGAKLSGRCRSKWCPSHAEVIREVQKSLSNAFYQRAWRERHFSVSQNRRRIYREVRRLERRWSQKLPTVQRKRLHWALLTSFRQVLDETTRECRNFLYRSAILPDGFHAIVELHSVDAFSLLHSHPGDGPCVVKVLFQRMGLKNKFLPAILLKPAALLIHDRGGPVDICDVKTVDSDENKVPWFYRGVCKRCGMSFSGDLLVPWLLQLLGFSIAWGWNGEGIAEVVRMPSVASALNAKDYLRVEYPDGGRRKSLSFAVDDWPLAHQFNLDGVEARMKRAAEEAGIPPRLGDFDGLEARLKCAAAHLSKALDTPRLRNFQGDWSHLGAMLLDYDQMRLAELINLKTCLRVFMAKEDMARND